MQLKNYWESDNIITDRQCGLVRLRNFPNTLVDVAKLISKQFDAQKAIITYLNLVKAKVFFNSISREKLHFIGLKYVSL